MSTPSPAASPPKPTKFRGFLRCLSHSGNPVLVTIGRINAVECLVDHADRKCGAIIHVGGNALSVANSCYDIVGSLLAEEVDDAAI